MKWLCYTTLLFLGLTASASAQECKPTDFTLQDIEKIAFSDTARYSAYSLIEQQSSEEEHKNFDGSAVIYGSPVSLSYADSRAVANYMLQESGFDYARDTRLAIVRTALSTTGAEMYSDCLAAQNIKIEIPTQAYTQGSFQMTVTWDAQLEGLANVPFEIRLIGGSVGGETTLTGNMPEKHATLFQVDKVPAELLQIDVVVGGQKYPGIVVAPPIPARQLVFTKRYGTYDPPRHGVGDECSDHAYLVAELGSAAGPDTKTCRLCVVRSSTGALLMDTAVVEGQLKDVATKTLEAPNQSLERCAVFVAVGRGQNGPRTEVNDGRLYIFEATLQ